MQSLSRLLHIQPPLGTDTLLEAILTVESFTGNVLCLVFASFCLLKHRVIKYFIAT